MGWEDKAGILMQRILSVMAVLVLPALSFAQEGPDEVFQAANRAYDQKDYPAAVEKYQQLLQKGNATSAVYYNLGNAYFRLGELGQAIWCYRKTQKLTPGDQDLEENLKFARLYRVDKITEGRGFFLSSALSILPTALGLDRLSWLFTFCWWLVVAQLLLYLVYRKRSRWIQFASIISVLFFLFLGTSLWSGLEAEKKKEAVIVAAEAEAKSGPSEDYVSLFTVRQGLECEIEEERDGWYLIYLSNGSKGWVPGKNLGLI